MNKVLNSAPVHHRGEARRNAHDGRRSIGPGVENKLGPGVAEVSAHAEARRVAEGLVAGLVNLCGMTIKSIADQGSKSATDLLNEAEKLASCTKVS